MRDTAPASLQETDAATVDALAAVLRANLIRCGNARARVELAARLAGEGMTAEQLGDLCDTVTGRGLPMAATAGIIGTILRSLDSWAEFLADLRFAVAARPGASQAPAADPLPGINRAPLDIEDAAAASVYGMTLVEYREFRQRRHLAALVHWDRYSPADAAELHGVTEAHVEECCAEFPAE